MFSFKTRSYNVGLHLLLCVCVKVGVAEVRADGINLKLLELRFELYTSVIQKYFWSFRVC